MKKNLIGLIIIILVSGCEFMENTCEEDSLFLKNYKYNNVDVSSYGGWETEGIEPSFLVLGDSRVWIGCYGCRFKNRIIDYSLGGMTTYGIIYYLLNNVRPDIKNVDVLVSIGGNDLLKENEVGDILINFNTIINILMSRKYNKIYIQEIISLTSSRGFKYLVNDLNKKLKVLCAFRGVNFIETPNMKTEDGFLRLELSYDGVHYNSEGYEVMFEDYVGQIDLVLKD